MQFATVEVIVDDDACHNPKTFGPLCMWNKRDGHIICSQVTIYSSKKVEWSILLTNPNPPTISVVLESGKTIHTITVFRIGRVLQLYGVVAN